MKKHFPRRSSSVALLLFVFTALVVALAASTSLTLAKTDWSSIENSPVKNADDSLLAGPGPVLKADYRFQGNLNSSVAGAPVLQHLTGSGGANSFANDLVDGYTRQTLRFPFNSGFSLNVAGLVPADSYTFVGLFRLDNVTGRRRIAGGDPNDVDANDGAYIVDGRVEGEVTTNAAFRPGHYIQLVVVREANGTLRAYRDGSLRVTFTDTFGDFILEPLQRYFQDDNVFPNEASAGNIARFRIYDGPLTAAQVSALDRLPDATGGGEQKLLFTATRDGAAREIYSMNVDGTNQRRMTNNDVTDAGAKWSPDGTKIVFGRVATGPNRPQVWVMNADGSNQTRLITSAAGTQFPSWSPDGTKIIYSVCTSGVCDLYTMNADGSNQAIIPNVNTVNDEDQPIYSPDGTKIIFMCSINGASYTNANVCVANADGSGRQQLTNTVSPIFNVNPQFSPDGSKIAFERWSNSANILTSDIFTMNSNGTGLTQLTNNGNIADINPVWSADGQELAFSSEREGAFVDIYRMNALTGTVTARLTTNSTADVINSWQPAPAAGPALYDYDGDRKSDVSVWRPSNGTWYVARSGLNDMYVQPWGLTGDVIVPADYDGDGKTDLAVRRPSDDNFYVFNSSNATVEVRNFGLAGDVAVPSDYNGDGKADVAVWRPSNGTWYLSLSGSGIFYVMPWGLSTDKPVPGDFDADGKTELAVWRPSDGKWYRFSTVTGTISVNEWGLAGDRPVQSDYNGDGRTDFAVYRPSNNTWFVQNSNDGAVSSTQWGLAGDFPVPGDYDGDGKSDVAVWRPSDATWYVNRSGSGIFTQTFGVNGDTPTPSAFVF